MYHPLIGITTYNRNPAGQFFLPAVYVEAVRAAGGVPFLLPPGEPHFEDLLRKIDGLILAGGGDIDPRHYGGQPHPAIYGIDPERDTFELGLARLALADSTPVLGICRGAQVLAVVSGSPLVVHVPDVFGTTVTHRISQEQVTSHSVQIAADCRLADVLQSTEVAVPSWHHQAIGSIPPGWRLVASAADGVIEAMEHDDHPFMLAVQWHPELSREQPASQRLFQAFVEAARYRIAH